MHINTRKAPNNPLTYNRMRNTQHRSLFFRLVLTALLASSTIATQAIAEDNNKVSHTLFNVESRVLDNGLHVIMHPRTTSDSVMLQLVIDVGLKDFPCDKQQIPHIIEHLLFENNTRYSPEELRSKIRDLGGYSNGWTTDENTHITINIHSDFEKEAIDALTTMVVDLRWDEDEMLRVKRIVDNELETPVSPIQRWYDSKRSVVEIAKGHLYPRSTLDCELRSAADPLSTTEIKAAYDAYYQADNMTLIVLGNLSPESLQWITDAFSRLPEGDGAKKNEFKLAGDAIDTKPLTEKGGFGSAMAWVNLLTRMPGTTDPDYAASEIITEYLNERLFAEVRLKYGLGYTPNAQLINGSDLSFMLASTKTRSDQITLTQQVFENVYDDLRANQIGRKDLQRLKRKLILKFEARERDALEIAELYRLHRRVIRETGHMPNLIVAYENVTKNDIQRIINRYLPKTPVIALLRPPTPAEASLAVTGIILGAAVLGWPMNLWIQRRRKLGNEKGA